MPDAHEPGYSKADLKKIDSVFSVLEQKARSYLDEPDLARLSEAALFGQEAHKGQYRDTGAPYFTHPLEVACLLADMRLDTESLITALLHDTVEDCGVSLNSLAEKFGENVSQLVDGVTKLTRIELQSIDTKQAENFRKLVVAMGKDIRVLLVKLADRTHNMRTLSGISAHEKRERIATETMEIFAPLAERMGITQFQHELEDLSFDILQPEMRQSIMTRLEFLTSENKNTIPDIQRILADVISKGGIECNVAGRLKTSYSIWRKMQTKNITMEQLSDVMAFRIIVDDDAACYTALGLIHQAFPMVMGRFKDYISTPKRNGYRSVHTGVLGPMNRKIEIQIRTAEMHDIAERGVAAHWDYKARQTEAQQPRQAEGFRWVRELISLLELNAGPLEFLEHTKMEMYADQVFCFTPRGDLIGLPKGATPIDFAYAVHSKIGDRCVGVFINDKRRQLATELENGDQVKIITDPAAKPRSEWEEFVVTGRAKSSIRRFIRLEKQIEFSRIGKALLEREYRFRKVTFVEQHIVDSIIAFGITKPEELYALLADGSRHPRDVFERLHPEMATGRKSAVSGSLSQEQPLFSISGTDEGMAVQLGKCCHPLPGDKIIGIITTGKGVTVHTKNCSILTKFVEIPELWLEVDWPRGEMRRYAGRIKAIILNEPGALAALCTVIGQQAGNITHIQLTERSLNFFTFQVDVDVKDIEHIHSIIAVLRSNKYIESVSRRSL